MAILEVVYEHELTTPDFVGYIDGQRWGRFRRTIYLRFDESSNLTPEQHAMVREILASGRTNINLPIFVNPISESKALELAYKQWQEWKQKYVD